MRSITIKILSAVILFLLTVSENAYSKIWTVEASNFVFTPDNLTSVMVGDTIRWVWVEGTHTTTSATIPAGAQTWDSPLSISVQMFEYVPTIAGTYNYVCTPHESFGMVGSFTVMLSTGLADLGVQAGIQIGPNPFRDRITVIAGENAGSIKEVMIYDESGRTIRSIAYPFQAGNTSRELNLRDLVPGVYFFRFVDNTNQSFSIKAIKE